jgi:hypothetical protein
MTITENKFETKYGFVSYSYENYKKLKRLQYLYHVALTQAGKWERWVRKDPCNRVIRSYRKNALGQRIGFDIVGPSIEPKLIELFTTRLVNDKKQVIPRVYQYNNSTYTSNWFNGWVKNSDLGILDEYRKAKYPVVESEFKEALFTDEKINDLLEKAEKEFAEINK